jgi:hypothetical protein
VKENPRENYFFFAIFKKSCHQAKISPKEKKKTHWVRAINKQYSNITT